MIAIASDHAGFEYKKLICKLLKDMNLSFEDFGTQSSDSVDYPDYAHLVSVAVAGGKFEKGILICGTGIGMSIAANKHKGIRAAVCESTVSAQLAREHNDANILCIGARTSDWNTAEKIIRVFLSTKFNGGERHINRINKIHVITNC
jgi:ribose 5-phosphate isomerase B